MFKFWKLKAHRFMFLSYHFQYSLSLMEDLRSEEFKFQNSEAQQALLQTKYLRAANK